MAYLGSWTWGSEARVLDADVLGSSPGSAA